MPMTREEIYNAGTKEQLIALHKKHNPQGEEGKRLRWAQYILDARKKAAGK